ncbi:MAG: glycosyltransferase family 4 protein [Methanomassiliicoccales archaeon]|nr:glycosyltransferase family 4 protein [Methanomassiliicoccales archaeon]
MRKKVLFVRPKASRFTEIDRRIFEKYYETETIDFGFLKEDPLKFLINHLRVIDGVISSDIVVIWFADFHALSAILFSKISGKKTVLIVGGYEVARIPELGYGGALNFKRRLITKFVVKNSTKVIAVSAFSKSEILKCFPSAQPEVIYNCVDTDFFVPALRKENIVLTVSVARDRNVALKGIATFVSAASLVKEAKFVIVGFTEGELRGQMNEPLPGNVECTGYLDGQSLLEWYQRAKVYCQLSRYESFGVALAEAMSCCCVPVVTREGALPEVVGDTGFYVPYGDVEATASAIREALQSDKGRLARQRVIEKFSVVEREKKLLGLIDATLDEH